MMRTPSEETRFWSRQFSEHLQFLSMLFTDEAAKREAERLKVEYDHATATALADPLRAAQKIRPAHELVRQYQGDVLERLAAGEFMGWAFPLFVDHITREMDLYAHLVYGTPAPDVGVDGEVKRLGAEHAQFAAHLLDPSETALTRQAGAAASALSSLVRLNNRASNLAAAKAERLIMTFVQNNGLGTPSGALSIIPKALADHVVREQIYFAETLESP